MPIVEMPNGDRVSFPDDMPKERIRSLIAKKFPEVAGGGQMANSAASQELSALTQAAPQGGDMARDLVRAKQEATKIEGIKKPGGATDFADSVDPLFGWGDEAYSAAVGAPMRMVREGVGYGDAYRREQLMQNELQTRREDRSPIASVAGKITGGAATGGTLAKSGLTLLGKSLPVIGKTGGAMVEGALYGGAQGAGDAPEGEKMRAGATGAGMGAATAGLLSKGGDMIAKRMTDKALKAATPTIETLRQTEGQLFDAARTSGVRVVPKATNRLLDNMKMAAGRVNPNLRQRTAGMLDDINALRNKALDVQDVHELRQSIQSAMNNADDQDVRTLAQMLKVLDNFVDNAPKGAVTGGTKGLGMLREAIDTSAKRFKVERINKLLDFADVKTGQYSQSGMMNALRSEASSLYKQIANGQVKGFTDTEKAIIRQLAKTENSSAATKLIAKLAPRGVVSMGLGSGLLGGAGFAVGGPAGAAIGAGVPAAAGYIAAHSADRAALNAATGLRDLVARGGAGVAQKLNPLLPLIRPATLAAGEYAARPRLERSR